MKWAKYVDRFGRETGDWVAKGEIGHFLLWKDGEMWRGLYKQKGADDAKFRFRKKTLREAKQWCEDNYYWEV
jgi:hypothetical protein